MRFLVWSVLPIIGLASATFCLGQTPGSPPPFFPTPSDYYSNGYAIDEWEYFPDRKFKLTYHYLKKNSTDLFWHQQIALKWDTQPDRTYFFDQVTRVWIGYYEDSTGKYSRLPEQYRRFQFQQIRPEWFPEPKDAPALFDMVKHPCEPKAPAGSPTLSQPPSAEKSRDHQPASK